MSDYLMTSFFLSIIGLLFLIWGELRELNERLKKTKIEPLSVYSVKPEE